MPLSIVRTGLRPMKVSISDDDFHISKEEWRFVHLLPSAT